MSMKKFTEEKKNKYLKELEEIEKITKDSPVIKEIKNSLKNDLSLTFNEVPKLHNDNDAILYSNLIQPTCPDVSPNFKLSNLIEIFNESSSIQAQNALRRDDIEFKGFWSSFTCFLISLINFHNTFIIPIMVYEYGFGFLKLLVITQFVICLPALIFVINVSQYSGLDSSRVYSRIKKVWCGIEYAVLIKTFFSIIIITQELQFTCESLKITTEMNLALNKPYFESCLPSANSCVDIGYIHPCYTGYSEDFPNNFYCNKINQISMKKYLDSKPAIKTISMTEHVSNAFLVPIYEKDLKIVWIMPFFIILLTTFLLYFGKAKCVAVVGLFCIPIIAVQLYVISFLTINQWSIDFNRFLNIEFPKSYYMSFVIIHIGLRSLNMVDLVPKISASLPSKIKAYKLAFLITVSNIIMFIIPSCLYIVSSIYYKKIIMKNDTDYGRIRTYELSNWLPYITLYEQLIINNKQYINISILVCNFIQRCFLLSIYVEIFYDYIKTVSMKMYTRFSGNNFIYKFLVTSFCYLLALFLVESTYFNVFTSPVMLMFLKMDTKLLAFQFFIIAFIYGMDKFLGNIREMNGKSRIRDKLLRFLKILTQILLGIYLMTSGDKEIYEYYMKKYFDSRTVIILIEAYSIIPNLLIIIPIILFATIEIIKSSINGIYWKTIFRNIDSWAKRENKFIKNSNLNDE
uniref:Amino acid transporter transmembrane domain-containing protein n=1 Tax=Strongyloides stercoralis TaxID=6248 RepID=A0A0K0EM01_STRER